MNFCQNRWTLAALSADNTDKAIQTVLQFAQNGQNRQTKFVLELLKEHEFEAKFFEICIPKEFFYNP